MTPHNLTYRNLILGQRDDYKCRFLTELRLVSVGFRAIGVYALLFLLAIVSWCVCIWT